MICGERSFLGIKPCCRRGNSPVLENPLRRQMSERELRFPQALVVTRTPAEALGYLRRFADVRSQYGNQNALIKVVLTSAVRWSDLLWSKDDRDWAAPRDRHHSNPMHALRRQRGRATSYRKSHRARFVECVSLQGEAESVLDKPSIYIAPVSEAEI